MKYHSQLQRLGHGCLWGALFSPAQVCLFKKINNVSFSLTMKLCLLLYSLVYLPNSVMK